MAVLLRWYEIGGLLSNDWIVNSVRIHTVKNFEFPDKTKRDTTVMAVMANAEQLHKIIADNGKNNIPLSILGIKVFPLIPNIIHWTWRYGTIESKYDRFEIFEENYR